MACGANATVCCDEMLVTSRPIGRGEAVRRAVRAATVAELTDRGYSGLTMEGVARRAGVHKTTVYRRWPDREALVTDALVSGGAISPEISDSGDIDADLQQFSRALTEWLAGPVGRPLMAVLHSEAGRLPAIVAAKQHFYRERFKSAGTVVTAAITRGQLPPGTDAAALYKTLMGPIAVSWLVTLEPVTRQDADRAAHIALVAARAGLLGGSSTPR